MTATTHGGAHERGLRSGTRNVPGIVGMGRACELAQKSKVADVERVEELRDHIEVLLLDIDGAFINGSGVNRLYNATNITLPGTDVNVPIGQLRNIARSNGSAFSSAMYKPSYV
ncbi:aminotransferase class V-fold PLP-dependent enzyme [Spirosoma liriopis]|uniref:aminotransferase class V-fold PLP-dependent enzyme n=1 Tax=Spirosoma liriopis TaxID=2937440 RepID=UPI0021D455D4|nr:aminotransferase class V-fold PLP-dependent enzyme [Spirosoma liriopis]